MKKLLALMLSISFIFLLASGIFADTGTNDEAENANLNLDSLNVNAKSAVLMEANTGTLLYAKSANEPLAPASVTKIMTLLLVAEALESEKIKLDDTILISMSASSMGGSQIFLEEGESMSVEDLLKSTVIASANDAAVALAEHVAGSESAFVKLMNERAKELGLKSTNFENATGLDDTTTSHLTSAYDIAVMSRELMKHDIILKYSGLWQDSVRNGEFTLTNTNRLVRYYKGCTGLKTGSTDKAGFCVRATAERDGMHLIAVVMGAETRDIRNEAAREMLDFGFANYTLYQDPAVALEDVPVYSGTKDFLTVYSSGFSILVSKDNNKKIEKRYEIPSYISAPVNSGDKIGEILYILDGKELGKADITVSEGAERITVIALFFRILKNIVIG